MIQEIERNKKMIAKLNEQYSIFNDELLNLLGDELFIAPYSEKSSKVNCYPGGMIDFALDVTKLATKINDVLDDEFKVNKNSLIRVCMLHAIGRCGLYQLTNEDWKNKKGIMYDFVEGVSMSVAERSMYFILKSKTELSEEEFSALMALDKTDENLQEKFYGTTIATVMKSAIDLVTKTKTKKGEGA